MADAVIGTATESKSTGKTQTPDDVLDLLNTDDAPTEESDEPKSKVKPKVEKEDKPDDEEDEGDDLELVDPEEEEETLDLDTQTDEDIEIAAPPRKKEILNKYPNLFKDFPFVEKMLYRDRQYTELFGSFDDAKELAGRADVFKEFENQLLSGKTENILKDVKDTDPKAFDRVVDNYMKSLFAADKDAYFEVAGNVIKQAIIEMTKDAQASKNDDLEAAAMLINNWMGWGSKLSSPKARVEEKKTEEQSEVEKERLEIVQERFIGARDTLQSQADNTLRATITEYIDPRNKMSSYVKKNAIKDTLDNLGDLMNSDTTFRKTLDNLWRSAFDAKFSQDSLNKIKRFYLGKAKSALPKAMAKARAEALKNETPREEEEEETTTPRKRGLIPAGRPSQPKKNEMKKGESVTDFFSRD